MAEDTTHLEYRAWMILMESDLKAPSWWFMVPYGLAFRVPEAIIQTEKERKPLVVQQTVQPMKYNYQHDKTAIKVQEVALTCWW